MSGLLDVGEKKRLQEAAAKSQEKFLAHVEGIGESETKKLINEIRYRVDKLKLDKDEFVAKLKGLYGTGSLTLLNQKQLIDVKNDLKGRELLESDEVEEIAREAKEILVGKDEWDEIVPEPPNIWLPDEIGEELVGEIIEIDEGEYGIYAKIDTGEGEEIQTPAHKILQSRIELCEVGDLVRIVYRGEVLSKTRRKTRDYALFIKKRAEEVG